MGICWQVFLVIGCIFVAKSNSLYKNPKELEQFLNDEYEKKASEVFYKQATADWNYATNITNENSEAVTKQTLITAKFEKEMYDEWFKDSKLEDITNESVKRQLKFLKIVGDAALNESDLTTYTSIMNNMTKTYSTAKICPFPFQKCDINTEGLSLEPGIENIMSTSTNKDELLYFWTEWRKATGTQLFKNFENYVTLSNKIGKENGFNDKGAMWRDSYDYESDKVFLESMDKLWKDVEPLYNKLHGYVKQKLVNKYGKEVMGDDDLIPAHLLGNMWGQSWINLADLARPYPSASKIDVTKALLEQNYTAKKMFEKSNEFYMSLELPTNEMSYGRDGMIEKPKDREVLCHASAWDFSDKKSFRIKMCTEVNYEDFITIHHEMGHIQYYLQYKDQPITFRSGANPGFHEAVGDTIALSVSTPKHLKAINLLDNNYKESEEATINAQMDMALERLAFLPFGLIVDKWRWEVFSGNVTKEQWNTRWWQMRSKYQKIKPPTKRLETDLDPAAKYHVIADSQYINYFVAHILEFQLYRGLCITAGEYDPKNKEEKPLHNCDFYNNKDVGKKLKAGLSLGLSQNWKEALKAMTGEEELSSKAILEYFEPLMNYLDENKEHTPEEIEKYIKGDYEKKASEMCTAQNKADWNYNTNITEKNNELATQQTLAYAKFEKEQYNEWFKNANIDKITDPAIKRQLKYLKVVGKAALDEKKLEQYTKTVNEMSGVYSTAKICPYQNQKCDIKTEGLSLEPGIESIMSSSKDEKELLYAWSAWRDATGKNLRNQFKNYVDLSNEIGKANNFSDKGEMWRNSYDYRSDKDFVDSMDKLWIEVEPLYNKLHRYVRQKLIEKYGNGVVGDDGLIPAHLLGNMWGQSWINLADMTRPYPSASKIDVTKALLEQKYTVKKMFEKSNEFYMSLELPTNEMSYGNDAMIEKPKDREVLCHASAWDFCNKDTYRIKMCTEVNYEDFITIHHEMGHIQYFIQYKNQPISFRDGANPGFHEAVGDTIALSVSTPKHLKAINLLDKNYKESEEATINAQMDMALERLAFLPFGLIVDKWRWEVFSGDVKPDKWNKRWWELRSQYQKLKPPTDRPETNLDPAAKYHVVGDSQYINYFVAHILEFQLYRGLCITAGEYDPKNKEEKPLHNCDFYNNKDVGKKLKAGLSLGLSQNWKEALKTMTGEEELSSKAILEYFEPLMNYLDENKEHTPEEIEKYIKGDYEKKASEMCTAQNKADWNYNTNITEKNNELATQQTLAYAKFEKEQYNEWFKNANIDKITDPAIKRQLKYLKVVGKAALDEKKLEQYTKTVNEMSGVYSTAKICPYQNQKCDIKTEGLSLEPGIESIMSSSKDEKELLYAWSAWRDATGKNLRNQFKNYVDLSNEIGKANNFSDKGEMWRNSYDYRSDKDFVDSMDKLWIEVEPLYNKLHRYVRQKLIEKYGNGVVGDDGLIPAHLLGNMWGQSWINLADMTRPYPSASKIDVTKALLEQKYTVKKMFEKSNEFYMSLELPTNEMSYGNDAMIEKPKDREVLCHASAWDFCNKDTYRIKMCTEVNYEDFITIHHEMGHIQYFIQYKNQPISFRDGANPGFHEAVGDTIALSVSTPKHLKAINLLDKNYKESEEATINAQMDMALERLAFLPFGLIVDKWRWEVFSGDVKPDKWNKRWWELRSQYQKLKPPTDRSETNLDPAAKYHVVGDSQYINYFVAHILEFQLYRGLCITAGEYDPKNKEEKPLHNCDFYNNKDVGKKLKAGLSLGLSQNWKEALKAMTGEEELSSKAILEYFEPLMKYLDENKEHTPDEIEKYIKGDYEKKASEMCTAQNKADWNYNTNITEKNNELATQQTLAYAKFEKEQYNEWFKNANIDKITDPAIKRQLKYLKVVGKAALDEKKLEQYTKTVNEMSGVYSTAKICPYQNQKCDIKTEGLSLEPGIESIMSSSKDEKELLYAWSAWRDATGKNLRNQFKNYVDLSNEIGKANNFSDKGEMWRNSYDYKSDKDFVDSMDKLWIEVEPLYNKLHRYVRQKLIEKYGNGVLGDDGLIPAHLLGNMWGQSWINLADLTRPYPSASKIDVTKALLEQKYTVKKMFEKSNEFYMSLELPTNEMSYGNDAMIEKPKDREVLCHASAWDFCNKETYRIKMCTEVNYEDFITIHHEMGHIQYFIQYKNQPISFRDGANPGFHEAVGDTIALSVSTPKHLKAINLLDKNYKESEEATINAQMDMALERLAFLPFGLIVDKWRWEVFSGDVKPDKWNKRWWELRSQYQKLKPPTDRPETNLDPAAKYHVVGDSQYINYFVAHILEFQLYRGLCITAGEYDPKNKEEKPLHNCDFYNNKDVGKKLKAGMSLGLSQNWKEALKAMTGEEELSSKAILEYFEPLMKYLDENKEHTPEEIEKYIKGDYEKKASEMCTAQNKADWNYNTNITEKNNELATQQTLAYAKFEKEQYNEWFKNANIDKITDPAIKRQLKYLKVVGKAALDENKLEQYTKTVNEMSGVYSTAKICPYKNQKCDIKTDGLSLEPGIESIMSSSKDEKELLYAWSAWRDATGKNLRNQFKNYVDLSNEIGKANNFSDKGEMWRNSYDYKSDKDFVDSMDKLWIEVEPLYNKLHRYVRQKLIEKYGNGVVGDDGLIPAHLLGNMWGQSWINLADMTRPYPSASKIDVTKALLEQKYTVKKMFEKSNEFYMSLELPTNEMSYGNDAMIEKPKDREVLCHASAWDFCDKGTYRIKMCTEVNYEDFITIHHEMGHIQYFIQYKNQPISFRDGANPGFHEAVGDTIALSVSTPKHLKDIDLLDKNYKESEEATINAQMDMALERLAFLPFGLIVDKWRWEVFSGDVKPDKWNKRWWELRSQYQKLKPPTDRPETNLDPAAKYHVVGDSQYINYFVAHILEFQLYRELCITAGEYDPKNKEEKPLHNCDFYNNKDVGKKLKAGLSLGLSENWKEALKAMTGEEELSSKAILEYFEPLDQYLTKFFKNCSSPIVSTFAFCLLSLLLVLFR